MSVIFAMVKNLQPDILYPIISCYIIVVHPTHFTLEIIVHFFVNRCIGQNVLCVGNVQQTIVDCFVLEAFREYRDDLRDHMSDNTQNRPKSETRIQA